MVEEVRLLYAPFKYFVSGHVCLLFKLADGKEVVISPEAWTNKFITVLGFTPFYRLRYSQLEYSNYVLRYQKTSRDLRSVKLVIEPNSANDLYKQMRDRVSDLEDRNERYHILFNSCITNTHRHLKRATTYELSIAKLLILPFKPQLLAVVVKESTMRG